ncbi:MAG: glycosyltransferase, partial [Bacteroidetes bacterium B1(2017)]
MSQVYKKGYNRIDLLGCPIDALNMHETISVIEDAIVNKQQIHHVVINGAKFVNMRKDSQLKEAIFDCDLINADGQSIVTAANFLGKYIPERVAGIDLMDNLVKLSFEKGYKIFFLGANGVIVKNVVDFYTKKYSSNIIAGFQDGYFKSEDEEQIANKIAKSEADI